jgi:hypothetical protein
MPEALTAPVPAPDVLTEEEAAPYLPSTFELTVLADPETSRKFRKRVLALPGGRMSDVRGSEHRRFIDLPCSPAGYALAEEIALAIAFPSSWAETFTHVAVESARCLSSGRHEYRKVLAGTIASVVNSHRARLAKGAGLLAYVRGVQKRAVDDARDRRENPYINAALYLRRLLTHAQDGPANSLRAYVVRDQLELAWSDLITVCGSEERAVRVINRRLDGWYTAV